MKEGVIFGCWDLFHVGHLDALKECSFYVDTLHVGVFSDGVVLSYKGQRPIIPQAQRLRIIQNINLSGCKINAYIVTKRVVGYRSADFVFVSIKLKGKELAMVDKNKYKGKIIYILYSQETSTSDIRRRIVFGGYQYNRRTL